MTNKRDAAQYDIYNRHTMKFLRSAVLAALTFASVQPFFADPLPVGKVAPALSVASESGQTINLSQYKGKVVLLNFWATWCAPCRVEMPWFEEFSQKYKDKGFVVLGVSMDEGGWKVAGPVARKLKITYPMGVNKGKSAAAYGITDALPVTYLIDRTGKIRAVKQGFGNKEDFEKTIQSLL